MRNERRSIGLLAVVTLFGLGCSAARMGASAITQPWRIPVVGSPSAVHQELSVRTEDGLLLQGWLFPVETPRGLVVLLHGKDINRQHFVFRAEHLQQLGYAVLAYDQRAHGRSEGKYLTYGAKEVPDLQRYLDAALATPALAARGPVPVVLIGESMGAAVALQAAAVDPRVRCVVAGASFSDLPTLLGEKAEFLSAPTRAEAYALADSQADFRLEDVSPVKAAAHIGVPVMLVHGSEDAFIPLRHSMAIYAALAGPKRLLRLEGAGHPDVLLHDEAWVVIEDFVNSSLSPWGEGQGRGAATTPPAS